MQIPDITTFMSENKCQVIYILVFGSTKTRLELVFNECAMWY